MRLTPSEHIVPSACYHLGLARRAHTPHLTAGVLADCELTWRCGMCRMEDVEVGVEASSSRSTLLLTARMGPLLLHALPLHL